MYEKLREGKWRRFIGEDLRISKDFDLECQRCGCYTHQLYKHYRAKGGDTDMYENNPIPEHEREEIWLCWDCDHEVTNGMGSLDDDMYEVCQSRAEREYEDDPLNAPYPY